MVPRRTGRAPVDAQSFPHAALFAAALLGRIDDLRTHELLDDEEIDPQANFSTQLLISEGQTGLKTTTCASWLQMRGIEPVEISGRLGIGPPRKFRSKTFLSGFDNLVGRRALDMLLPVLVVDAGIGARVQDFTGFRVHVFPQKRLPSEPPFNRPATIESALAMAREKSAFAASRARKRGAAARWSRLRLPICGDRSCSHRAFRSDSHSRRNVARSHRVGGPSSFRFRRRIFHIEGRRVLERRRSLTGFQGVSRAFGISASVATSISASIKPHSGKSGIDFITISMPSKVTMSLFQLHKYPVS